MSKPKKPPKPKPLTPTQKALAAKDGEIYALKQERTSLLARVRDWERTAHGNMYRAELAESAHRAMAEALTLPTIGGQLAAFAEWAGRGMQDRPEEA